MLLQVTAHEKKTRPIDEGAKKKRQFHYQSNEIKGNADIVAKRIFAATSHETKIRSKIENP